MAQALTIALDADEVLRALWGPLLWRRRATDLLVRLMTWIMPAEVQVRHVALKPSAQARIDRLFWTKKGKKPR